MFTPPPVPGQPAKKNNTLSIVLIVVSLACLGICGVGGFFTFRAGMDLAKGAVPMVVCAADLQTVRDALVAYHDKNGSFPKSEKWMDDIEPFMKYGANEELKELKNSPMGDTVRPIAKGEPWGCSATETKAYAFAYNANLAGKKMADIKDTSSEVLVFESSEAPKRNLAKPYAKPAGDPEPKLMGNAREWMRAPIRGEIIGSTTSSSTGGVKVSTTPN